MESIPNFEELETIEKTIFLLIYTAISFAAYLISIKGMYDLFPNLFKALGAFLAELAISAILAIAMYGITRATTVDFDIEFNPILLLASIVAIIVTVLARKVTLNYATDVPTAALQAVNSLVMHFFYTLVISLLIIIMYIQIFDDSIDLSTFVK